MMKKGFRLFTLSALVLAALGFSAIGAMALTPVTKTELPSSSMTPEPKDKVVGTVMATDVTSTEPASTVEPVGTETASPDKGTSHYLNGSSLDKSNRNSSQDSGNGSGQNMGGSNSSQDSQNGSTHDSGSGSSNGTSNGGN
jgi:hypothetical protein